MLTGSTDPASFFTRHFSSSAILVLQTTLFALFVYLAGKLVKFIKWRIQTDRVFLQQPGPPQRHWLFGSFKNMPDDAHERLDVFIDWCNTYSREKGFVRLWSTFWRPLIVACHPSSMRTILKTAEPKPLNMRSGYRTLRDWLGDGLLISGGEKWARNRRLLTPAFHFDILKPYIHVYNDSADVFVDKLSQFARDKQEFELFQHVCQCTLDIILRCAFSYEIDVQKDGETHPYVVAVNDLATTNSARSRRPVLAPDFIFYRTAMGRKYKQDCDYVHSVAEDIIQKRREILKKLGSTEHRKYLDFLDILLTAKDDDCVGLSDLDIRSEVDTFLFEGHDTTASAISWILYSLAEHPECQARCQEEIDAILGDRNNLEWSDLSQLEYLTMCIKEGMRMYCPVAIVARVTTKDLTMADITVPPGTNVMINIWMLHHNEEVWGPDHWDFKPERFSKENCAKMDPYQFVPFSGGPRNCIGQNFAMNEEKVVLAKLLHNFRFRLVPGFKVRRRLAAVMRAENGIMMTVERRNPHGGDADV